MFRSRWYITSFVLVACLSITGAVIAQESLEGRIDDKQDELSNIKKQIEDHRSQSKRLKKDERSVLGKLSSLDKEIDLQRQFLRNLAQQEALITEHIDSLGYEIEFREGEVSEGETALAKRLRQMYKRDPEHRWSILLGSASLQNAFHRYKFMKIIAEQDAVTVTEYREEKLQLQVETASLQESLSEIALIRQDRQVESHKLESSRKERESMLKRIRSQKSQNAKAIARLEKTQKEVQDLLGRLEKRRLEEQARGIGGGDFAKLQGKMLWPVEGKVKRKFGKIRHPKYGTVTFNNGIDIAAAAGTPIRAVAPGTVEFVDWIEAYGKCIILNHGGAYYTLYAHVSQTFVTQGQSVDVGSVIAEVGDTGSLDGFECHFEVRQGKKALDPLSWLSKQPKSSS